MEGYRVPPFDPNSVNTGNGTATSSIADNELVAATLAGQGKRIFITWIAITNKSDTVTTRIELKSGSTVKAVFPAPAGGGMVFSLPTPIPMAENQACNFATIDSTDSVYVTVGYAVGPK